MITHVKEIIEKNKQWLKNPHSELSFMKMSTPASGREVHQGKVLIFVFEKGQKYPTICVKTTRTHLGAEIIKRNFENLKAITAGVEGTEFADMFSKPLYFHDDGSIAFLIETVCPGEMFSSQEKSIGFVFEKYCAWQEEIARTSERMLRVLDLDKIVSDFTAVLPVTSEAKEEIKKYYKKYTLDPKTVLPELVQHGDMTPDNVLVSGDSLYLIDYDFVGLSTVPGFDLFHFISKSKHGAHYFRELCEHYFPKYFERVGATVTDYEPILFIYYIQESLRKGVGGKNGKEIIDNFEYLLQRS